MYEYGGFRKVKFVSVMTCCKFDRDDWNVRVDAWTIESFDVEWSLPELISLKRRTSANSSPHNEVFW